MDVIRTNVRFLYHFPALLGKILNIFTGVDLKTGDFHGGAGE